MECGSRGLTISCGFTQRTAEASAGIDKLHIWRHVCLASHAANRSKFAKVNNRRNDLAFDRRREWRNNQRKRHRRLLDHVRRCWHIVHRRPNESRPRVSLIVCHEFRGDQRRHQTRIVCHKRTGDRALILGHDLNRIRHLIGIETTLWWRCGHSRWELTTRTLIEIAAGRLRVLWPVRLWRHIILWIIAAAAHWLRWIIVLRLRGHMRHARHRWMRVV